MIGFHMLKSATLCCFLAVLTFGAASQASADIIYWNPDIGGNGHYYDLIFPSSLSWLNAKALAESQTYAGVSGQLASITSAAENQFVEDSFKTVQANGRNVHAAWIGLTDALAFGGMQNLDPDAPNWVWLSGDTVTYTNWLPGSPNMEGPEYYGELVFDQGGRWNDLADFAVGPDRLVLVEFAPRAVPEPSTLALAVSGALTLLAFAVRRFPRK